jgi:hypothetical protein
MNEHIDDYRNTLLHSVQRLEDISIEIYTNRNHIPQNIPLSDRVRWILSEYGDEIIKNWETIQKIYLSSGRSDYTIIRGRYPLIDFYLDNRIPSDLYSAVLLFYEVMIEQKYYSRKMNRNTYTRRIVYISLTTILLVSIATIYLQAKINDPQVKNFIDVIGGRPPTPYLYMLNTNRNSIQISAGGSVVSSTMPISSGFSGAVILLDGPPELRSGDSGVIRLNLEFVTNTNGLQAYIPLPELKPYSVTSRLQPGSFKIEPTVAGLREEQRLALHEQPAKWAWSIETPDTRLGNQEVVIDILIKDAEGHIISNPSTLRIAIKDPVGTPSSTVYTLRIVAAVLGFFGSLGLLAFMGRALVRWWKKVRSLQRRTTKSKIKAQQAKSSQGKKR